MRIAVVSHFPPAAGGMPRQAGLLADLLEQDGAQVFRLRTNLTDRRMSRFVSRIRILRTAVRAVSFAIRLVWVVPRVRVVHILAGSGWDFLVFTAPAVLVSRVMGRRVVLNYHGGGAARFFARFGSLAVPVVRRAHVLTVPSSFLVNVFARFELPAVVVPNVLGADDLPVPAAGPLQPKCLVARHLEPEYGLDTVLRAARRIRARFPTTTVTVLGDGSARGELEDLVAELGLDTAVHFAGAVGRRDVARHFAAASIMLNGSRVDNQPIALLEAFAAGLPVVSTDAGGIPYMVDHDRTGLLVAVGDDEAMADQVLRLLEDPALADRLRRAARTVAETHAWPAVRARLAAVYAGSEPVRDGAATGLPGGGPNPPASRNPAIRELR